MKPAADVIAPERGELSRDALRTMADGLTTRVAVVGGPRLVQRYANAAFAALARSSTVEGRPFENVWPFDAESAAVIRRVLDTGEPGVLEGARYPVKSDEGRSQDVYLTVHYTPLLFDGERSVLIEAVDTTQETARRIQVETELGKAEEQAYDLADVFENMADGFAAVDEEWRFKYVNGAAEHLAGRTRDELLERSAWDAFPELVGTALYERVHRAMRDKIAMSFEDYYEPRHVWLSLHVIPIDYGLALYVADITSRKQTEAALATSEGQLRAVIDNCPAVIYMEDVDGRFIRVNDEFVTRFDSTKEQTIGKTDYDLFPQRTADVLRKNDLLVLETGESHQFEEDVEFRDGHSVRYLSTKFPLKDSSGRVYATAGISTDINERVRQQRALAESEQRFRKIFQEGPMGIALLDTTLTFAQVNDRYADILGYSPQEMVGTSIADSTIEEDRKRSTELPLSLLGGEIPYYRVEKRARRRDGSIAWVSVHGSLLRDELGEPMFILQLVEDITEQKAALAALREKDLAIRQAYSEVIAAVTGGKLVLMTPNEIGRAIGAPASELWHVDDYAQLATLRHNVSNALSLLGMDSDAVDSYVLAACEAFTNAIKHGHGGEVRIHRNGDTVQIVVSDRGPGIHFEHLPKATLVSGFSTVQSLGMGFTIMLDVCDRLLLSTQPGLTLLVLEATHATGETHASSGEGSPGAQA